MDSPTLSVDGISELIAKHKLLAVYVAFELFFLVGGYTAGQIRITVDGQEPALSHVVAGLMGGLAVVWLLIGAVTYGVVLASNLFLRYQREM